MQTHNYKEVISKDRYNKLRISILGIYLLSVVDLPFTREDEEMEDLDEDTIPCRTIGDGIIGMRTLIEDDPLAEDEDFPEQIFHDFLDLDLADGQVKEDQCAIDAEEPDIPPTHATSMQTSGNKIMYPGIGTTNLLFPQGTMVISNPLNHKLHQWDINQQLYPKHIDL